MPQAEVSKATGQAVLVAHLIRLLEVRGNQGAAELRKRIERKESFVLRGLRFDEGVMSQALQSWEQGGGATQEDSAYKSGPGRPRPEVFSAVRGELRRPDPGLPAETLPAKRVRLSTTPTTSLKDLYDKAVGAAAALEMRSKRPARPGPKASAVPRGRPSLHQQEPQAAERRPLRELQETCSQTACTLKREETCRASGSSAQRDLSPEGEVQRIASLRRDHFSDSTIWGFAVLSVTLRTVESVQRGYRVLMKKLHPDKVGHISGVSQVVEVIRQAKDLCVRSLSHVRPPSKPAELRSKMLCAVRGRRQIQLQWAVAEENELFPVHKYIVAVFDPAYGRALTITVLEPDYSEELKRYVPISELNSFVLAEEELTKMPGVFKQMTATVQVAAANEAGQSDWATMEVPMVGSRVSDELRTTGAIGPGLLKRR